MKNLSVSSLNFQIKFAYHVQGAPHLPQKQIEV